MEIEEIARKFKGNFPLYSKNVLRIVTKEGESKPFVLNAAQLYVHNMLEKQLKDHGKHLVKREVIFVNVEKIEMIEYL